MGKSAIVAAVATGSGSAEEYLRRLPAGLRSYPACEADAALVLGLASRGVLEGLALPVGVAESIEGARTSGWLYEVAHVAVLLALRDARFGGGAQGDDAFIQWVEGLSRPLVVAQATPGSKDDPQATIRGAPRVWARFHRGTSLEVQDVRERRATVVHRHPDGIFPPVVREWRRRVLCAMLAGAGAATPRAQATVRPGVGTVLSLSW